MSIGFCEKVWPIADNTLAILVTVWYNGVGVITMPIDVRLSAMMGARKIRSINRSHELTGISRTTLTTLWYGRAKGISFDTLETLCKRLDCQPGDLLVYVPDEKEGGR